jgi:hypothetical protein
LKANMATIESITKMRKDFNDYCKSQN